MKTVLLVGLLACVFTGTYSQNIVSPATSFLPRVDSVAEALVEIALANAPRIKSAQNAAASSKYNYRRSKTTWLNNITAIGNINEFTINPRPDQTIFYPRYNFGAVLPLGIFFNNPKQTKSDFYQYKATEDRVDIEKRSVRQEVLSLYQDYLLNMKLREIQVRIVNDFTMLSTKNEERFKEGQITLETFTNSNLQYYNAMTRQATIEHDLQIAKAKLEELIGMDLEQAIDQILNRPAGATK